MIVNNRDQQLNQSLDYSISNKQSRKELQLLCNQGLDLSYSMEQDPNQVYIIKRKQIEDLIKVQNIDQDNKLTLIEAIRQLYFTYEMLVQENQQNIEKKDELSDQIQILNHENDKIQEKIEQQNDFVINLQKQMDQFSQQSQREEEETIERITMLKNDNIKAKMKIEELERVIQANKEIEEAVLQDIQTLQMENNSLKDRIDEQMIINQDLEAQLGRKHQNYQAIEHVQILEKEMNLAQIKIEDQQQQIENNLKEEQKTLEHIGLIEQQNSRFNEKIREMNNIIHEKQLRIDQYQKEILDYQDQADFYEHSFKNIQTQLQQQEAIEKQNSILQLDIERYQQQLSRTLSLNQDLQKDYDDLKDVQKYADDVQQQNELLLDETNKIRSQYFEIKKQNEQLMNHCKTVKDENENLTKRNNVLMGQISQTLDNIDQLKSQTQHNRNNNSFRNKSFDKTSQKLNDETNQLQEQINQCQFTIQEIRKTLGVKENQDLLKVIRRYNKFNQNIKELIISLVPDNYFANNKPNFKDIWNVLTATIANYNNLLKMNNTNQIY